MYVWLQEGGLKRYGPRRMLELWCRYFKMASNTTIIFVPGAWHPASCWGKVAKHLEQAGFRTVLVDLPSVGAAEHLKGFEPDVEDIRHHIGAAADTMQKVVLVCHSNHTVSRRSGCKDPSGKHPTRRRLPIVYCSSFVTPEGECLISVFG